MFRACVTALNVMPGQDRRNALAGIDILRKICNHPDLLQRRQWEGAQAYGDPVRSGKLTVALKVKCLPTTITDETLLERGSRMFSLIASVDEQYDFSKPCSDIQVDPSGHHLVSRQNFLSIRSLRKGYFDHPLACPFPCRCCSTGPRTGTRRCGSRRRSRCWTLSSAPARPPASGALLAQPSLFSALPCLA